MRKALELQFIWLTDFGIGLIQIIDQKYRGQDFAKGSTTFFAKNKVHLISAGWPSILEDGTIKLYVRGGDESRDNNICVIKDYGVYVRIIQAVDEYNEWRDQSTSLDYLRFHRLLWMKLAESGSHDKFGACMEVMDEEHIPNPPTNFCFLCEDTIEDEKTKRINCKLCKGFWGPQGIRCNESNSYFNMWFLERDINLRKALALRIANNTVEPLDVTPKELETAFHEGKIPAIKLYRSRTGQGLKESKDAIEEAMDKWTQQQR